MRKLLITLLIIILLVGLAFMVSSGMQIGRLDIASIKKIITENNNLDEQIEKLKFAVENDYESAKTSLDTSLKKLQESKQKYESKIAYSTEEDIKAASQKEKYKMGYLWTKIGLYATNNNIVMQANVSNATISGLYDINFAVIGSYMSISNFIYAIEEDTNLGFKIEDFDLKPYSGDELRATFYIRNISIDADSLMASGAITTTQTTENS